MRHVKRGRGPSMMGGIFSLIGAVVFLLVGLENLRSGFMGFNAFTVIPFLFSAGALCMAVYNFKNSVSKNRYSEFDVTDPSEEPDPLNARIPPDEAKYSKRLLPLLRQTAGSGGGQRICVLPLLRKKAVKNNDIMQQ